MSELDGSSAEQRETIAELTAELQTLVPQSEEIKQAAEQDRQLLIQAEQAMSACQTQWDEFNVQAAADAKKHGVEVRHICVNNSLWDNTIEMGGKNKYALRIGFRQIKGFSNKDANKIISARGNGYYKVCDIFFRSEIKYKSLLKIIKSDCLNALGLTRNEAFWEAQKLRPIKEMSLVRGTFDNIFSHEDTFVLPKDTTGRELVKDYKILNYSFRSHPVKLLRSYLEKLP